MRFHFFHGRSRFRGQAVHRAFLTALVAGAGLMLLAGCGTDLPDGLPGGTWTDDWDYSYHVTRSGVSLRNSDGEVAYRAEFLHLDTGALNGGDSSVAANVVDTVNPGHAIIRYTEVSDPSWGEVDKYNVFRWSDGSDAGSRFMTQGGKYEGTFGEDDFRMVVFDSAQEARAGATVAEGFFAFAGEYVRQ